MRTAHLASLLLLAAAPAAAQEGPTPRASPWFVGASIAIPYGAVRDGAHSTHVSPAGLPFPFPTAADLRAGRLVGPRLVVAAELSGALAANGFVIGDFTTAASASLHAVATVFVTAAPPPAVRETTSRGWFARGGAGVSRLDFTFDGGPRRSSWTATGPSLLAGLGYAVWLGTHRSGRIGLDVNHQRHRRAADGERGLTLFLLVVGVDFH